MWTKQQVEHHKEAARLLIKIKDLTFEHIQKNKSISEYEVQQFIVEKFHTYNLKTDKYPPIVAFNKNSATPEFYPKKVSDRLYNNTFILVDLWARLNVENAPFADITWVAFYGKNVPPEIQKVFDIVTGVRDDVLLYIKNQLKDDRIPTGRDAALVAFEKIKNTGHEKNILHELGHSIGINQDHGPKPDWLYQKNRSKLHKNLAYTIEPGIYIADKFGVRSEIDFYISEENKVIVTTDVQKEIMRL